MATDRKSKLSERYARAWDLLAFVAVASECVCSFDGLTVHGRDAVVRAKRICQSCAAQEALRALVAGALQTSIRTARWQEMPKAIAALEEKGL